MAMALLRKTTAENDPSEIPDLLADPKLAAATELLGQFNVRHDRLREERLRLTYEIHFSARAPGNDGETDKMLRAKLASLRALPPLTPTPVAAPAAPSSAIGRGLAVLAGETITPPRGFGEQIVEIDRQLEVLGAAIRDQMEIERELREARIEVQRDKMAHTDEEGRAVAVEVVHRHRMAACAMIRPGSMNMAKQARLK
jgi:hypothetical protein